MQLRSYLEYNSVSESQKQSVARFWEAFKAGTTEDGGIDEAFMRNEADDLLLEISPDLSWEIAPGLQKPLAFVVSPELDYGLEPLTEYLFSTAPDYPGWEFHNWRPRRDFDFAVDFMLRAINWVDAEECFFRLAPGANNRLDFTLLAPFGLELAAQKTVLSHEYLANLLASMLVGERSACCWLNAPDVMGLDADMEAQGFAEISRFRQVCDAQLAVVRDNLPEQPHYVKFESEQRMAFGVNPKPTAPEERKLLADIIAGTTVAKFLPGAMFDDGPGFFGERYSRNGELFAFLAVDGTAEDLDPEAFGDREDLEIRVHKALRADESGSVIGGATGEQYSYVFLALEKPETGVPAALEALRASNAPKRAWLRFFEAPLAREWRGARPDSPEPPPLFWQ